MRPRSGLRRACAHGFTLIELLVVVAIIGLLISILLPSLNNARKQAKGVVCLSNMRALMSAVYIYAENSNGRFPSAGFSHSAGQVDDLVRSWVVQLAEDYGKDLAIARCPMDESEYWEHPLFDNRRRQTSFASNSYMVYPIAGLQIADRWERIPRPTSTIFWVELTERGEFAAADHVHPENWWFGDPAVLASREVQILRHKGKANYAFLDGHAEAMLFPATYKVDPEGGFPPKFLINKYDPTNAH